MPPFELWMRSNGGPPQFEPERVTTPPFSSRTEAEREALAFAAADRVIFVVERDEDGNVVPEPAAVDEALAAHDAEATANGGIPTDGHPEIPDLRTMVSARLAGFRDELVRLDGGAICGILLTAAASDMLDALLTAVDELVNQPAGERAA